MVAPGEGEQKRKKKNRGARGGENRGVKRRLEEVEAELAQSNARLLKVKGKRDADRDELTSTHAKLEKIRRYYMLVINLFCRTSLQGSGAIVPDRRNRF